MSAALVWIAIGIVAVLSVVVAAFSRKGMGTGASEFFLGGRRLKGFVSGMTYAATTYSAFMLVGLVGLTYRSGVGALGFEMTYLLFTVLFLVVFGPRFWLIGRRYDHITPPEVLAERYESKAVARLAAIISFFMLVPYASAQLIGAGRLVEGLSGGSIPYMAGVGIMAAVAAFSALYAGMRSVAWTDALQGLVMISTSLSALVVISFQFFGTPMEFVRTIETQHPDLLRFTWTPELFIGLTLPWAFFALTNPQVSQRMMVPDRAVSLKRMIMYFAIFGFIYTIVSTLFGFQAAHIVPNLENPDQAMPALLAQLHPVLAMLIFIGIFAAASSTLGSILLTLSSLSSRDVFGARKEGLNEARQTLVGQLSVVFLLAICIVFAWSEPGLIAVLSSAASGGLLVMAPTIIGAFFWRRSSAVGAITSMSVGALFTAGLYIAGLRPLGWWPPVWGLGLTTAIFVIVSLLTRPPRGANQWLDTLHLELEYHGFRRGARP